MITVHLSKPESTLEAVRKAYPKLRATDAALLATAFTLSGRYALAVRDGEQFEWTGDHEKLSQSVSAEVELIQQEIEVTTKKAAKELLDQEPAVIAISLIPNYKVGEEYLGRRKELITILSDVLHGGVEFVYAATDIGWQWSLDRTGWATLRGSDLVRRVKIKTNFTDGAVGTEMGAAGAKRRPSRAKAAPKEKAPAAEESDE